jgi:hypothetical protein
MANAILVERKLELSRRIENLSQEVQVWKDATESEVDKNAHFSQLRAIEVLATAFKTEQESILADLDASGDVETFNTRCLELVRSLIRARKSWDFFRDKLDLRHSPAYRRPLWLTDTIAWNCHRPVLDLAVEFKITDGLTLREPPLVYCTAEYSPATWVRGSRPNDGRVYDLGEALLPIPVIEIPWDQLQSAWEYLALHHEVGHDIEADLKLRPALQTSLQQTLSSAGVPLSRTRTWLKWQGEVFADLCALRLAGPAFADALLQLLLLPQGAVKAFDEDDPHPTPYVRILMNTAYIRSLVSAKAASEHAARIEAQWKSIYGADAADPVLDACMQDFSLVFKALMGTQLAVLKGRSVADLLPFTEADDARIRSAEKYFRTGMNLPKGVPLRHTVSAARLAVCALMESGALTDEACAKIHERVREYVESNAPAGLRGGGPDKHEEFIASFAKRMFPS